MLRYAFAYRRDGFRSGAGQRLLSGSIIRHLFDAPLAYDFLAPAKIVPYGRGRCRRYRATSPSSCSDPARHLLSEDHPAFKAKRRELVAQDYVYSIKRFYHPKFKSPNVTLLENEAAGPARDAQRP